MTQTRVLVGEPSSGVQNVQSHIERTNRHRTPGPVSLHESMVGYRLLSTAARVSHPDHIAQALTSCSRGLLPHRTHSAWGKGHG